MLRPAVLALAALLAAPGGADAQPRQFCADNRGGFVASVIITQADSNGRDTKVPLGQDRHLETARTLCVTTPNPHGVFVRWNVMVFGVLQGAGCTTHLRQGRAVVWGTVFDPICYVE